MGFWDGLIKVVQGKPVFEAGETTEQTEAQNNPAAEIDPTRTAVDQSGYKIIPGIEIEHLKSHSNDSKMEVTAWITNRSTVEIELDKIVMLGKTMELDRILAPNEGHEARLYEGEVAKDDSHHTANLYYKQRSSGDYFCADFTIEYNYDSAGYYEVEELHPVHPVRDV